MSAHIHILLVDDDPADAFLTQAVFQDARVSNNVHHVSTGREALWFLRREQGYEDSPRPNLIVLDLNMPGLKGHDVLAEIKEHPRLRQIPVVMLSSSENARDVATSYDLQAACHIRKPTGLASFTEVVQNVVDFWLGLVTLTR